MKIIIQAGGLGTRMKRLTAVKPKSIISAKYMPIIFHLFEKYPNDEFVIIGDYKFDVLDRYLATFAKDVNYILLKSTTKGNAAGIKQAVSFIPEHEPFMIIWSDIILSDTFAVNEIKNGCQIGIADFPCSWSLIDGKLEQVEKQGAGVAGLYVFNNKSWFDDFPNEGSFTIWLQNKGMPLSPISLMGSIDVGTLDAYEKINSTVNRCRPYNKIEFIDGKIVKTGLTREAIQLIEREVVWYRKMQEYGFTGIPKVYANNPLTLEYIDGSNIFGAGLDDAQKEQALDKIITTLKTLHGFESVPANHWDLYTEYFQKTIYRLLSIQSALPFAYDPTITINGRKCCNVLYSPNILRQAVLNTLMAIHSYGPIHGDCQLTNTLIDKKGRIYFIDPRGYFGKTQIFGDARYDWAKLFFALAGNFDQFNVKSFDLVINGEVNFAIHSGGWEYLVKHLLATVPKAEGDEKEIKLIHAIIWLSMASHAWEDFDSMCVAFYNGTLLFNEWLAEYGDNTQN